MNTAMPNGVRFSTNATSTAVTARIMNGMGMPSSTLLPMATNGSGSPAMTVPRVSQMEMPLITDMCRASPGSDARPYWRPGSR